MYQNADIDDAAREALEVRGQGGALDQAERAQWPTPRAPAQRVSSGHRGRASLDLDRPVRPE